MTDSIRCGFDLNRCPHPVTTALRVGDHDRDTLACDNHADKIRAHQATLDVPVTSRPIDATPLPMPCSAFWRSHGCSLNDDHQGLHQCECGDHPDARDECFTFHKDASTPVDRHGGVRNSRRVTPHPPHGAGD